MASGVRLLGAGLRTRVRPTLLLLGSLALLGLCSGCGPPPLENWSLQSVPNAFDFSVTLNGASGVQQETWELRGLGSWIEWGDTSLEEGSFSLELHDPDGLQAYRESARSGQVPVPAASGSASGAGTWTVDLAWTAARGRVMLTMRGVQ